MVVVGGGSTVVGAAADGDAFRSARVMVTAFPAGVAVALGAQGREPDIMDVQRELLAQDALI